MSAGIARSEVRRRVRVNLNQSSEPSDATQSWQDIDINDYIIATIEEISPEVSIQDSVNSGFLTVTGQYIYPISATNLFELKNIEVWNTGNSTKLYRLDDWQVQQISGAPNIVFNIPFDEAGLNIRMDGNKRIFPMSADGVSTGLSYEHNNLIVLGATTKAFRAMLADRIQFSKYITKIQKEDGRSRDILQAVRDFQAEYDKQLERLQNPGGLSFIGTE